MSGRSRKSFGGLRFTLDRRGVSTSFGFGPMDMHKAVYVREEDIELSRQAEAYAKAAG